MIREVDGLSLMQMETDHNNNNNNSGCHNLPDTVLLIFLKFTQPPHEAVSIIVPSVQMRILRLQEERLLAQGHATRR